MAAVAYVVTIEVAPEIVDEWSRWLDAEHVPALLAQPGFVSATRYRDESIAFDGWTRYVVRYDVDSRDALRAYHASSEAARLRADHDARWGSNARVSRQVWIEM
jgi:hypothetical protein